MKPRLLFIAPVPPPFGGIALVSEGLLDSALQTEFKIEVLELTKKRDAREQNFRIGFDVLIFNVKIWFRLVIKLLRFDPHIVYLASSCDASYLRNAVLMFTARIAGSKVVCHFHGGRDKTLFDEPRGLLKLILRFTGYSFDKIIVLTKGLRASLALYFDKRKAVVVPNFVDVAEFQVATAASRAPELRVIFVGRLSADKGIYDLIEASAKLKSAGFNFIVDLVGVSETEKEERAIYERAKQCGLKNAIIFHGVKAGREKAALLSGASVFVLPSKLEIFPVALLEAYASGLPVVCTGVGAVPEIVKDGENGFLVEASNQDALANRLGRLLRDDVLREKMGAANRRAAETIYSKDRAVEKVCGILHGMIKNHR